jgi:hypothetical protein
MDEYEGWCTEEWKYAFLFLSGYLSGDCNAADYLGDGRGGGIALGQGDTTAGFLNGNGMSSYDCHFYFRWRQNEK